jgi:hypothetical protein
LAFFGELGRNHSRWVSKNPTERKKGLSLARSSRSSVTGTTSSVWLVLILTTSSYPIMSGFLEMCCSPINADQYPRSCSVWTMWCL